MSDIEDYRRKVASSHVLYAAFQTAFRGTGDSGALVLAAIGNRCGINAFSKEGIDPSLVAFWNWLLEMLGVRGNIGEDVDLKDPAVYERYIQESRVLLSISNMNDVQEELSALEPAKEEQDGGSEG